MLLLNIHHHHHYDQTLEARLMAISAQVQAALDGIRQTKTLVKSVADGVALSNQMLADQKAQIAALQAQLDAGGTIGADDLAALKETNQDITDVNTQLGSAIPANVPVNTPPAPGS